MPKIKVICRDSNNYQKNTKTEIEKVYRNPNPTLHPMLKAREYVRALNAAKIDKIFAKPFIFSLDKHTDGVKTMAKNPHLVNEIVSGTFDGQIILWDLARRVPLFNINSKHEYVKSLTFSNTGNEFLSVGDDMKVNLWNKSLLFEQNSNQFGKKSNTNNINDLELIDSNILTSINYTPKHTFLCDSSLESIDHCNVNDVFATAGGVVAVWNYNRNKPVTTFSNSTDGFIKVKYNFVEENILLATGIDRSISLYDARINTPTYSVTLKNKSAAAAWNPQEPFTFTVGNEDSNCYTFDTRRLDKVKTIHKDHILAVLDIDYSPTGREFVTGSFDKTIRIFESNEGRSREVYYNKRMQK